MTPSCTVSSHFDSPLLKIEIKKKKKKKISSMGKEYFTSIEKLSNENKHRSYTISHRVQL
jgi:hypothetical protein